MTDLKLVWSERRGYHLTLPIAHRELAEQAGFIKIASQAKKTVACSTEQIVQLSTRAKVQVRLIGGEPLSTCAAAA